MTRLLTISAGLFVVFAVFSPKVVQAQSDYRPQGSANDSPLNNPVGSLQSDASFTNETGATAALSSAYPSDDYASPSQPQSQLVTKETKISAYPSNRSAYANTEGRVEYIIQREAGSGKNACGCGGENRQGDGCPHPWRTGHGVCDDYCVGPHWDITAEGLIFHRNDLDTAKLAGIFGGPVTRSEQFGFAAGARAYATGWSNAGYGLQLGYVGVDRWTASGRANIPGPPGPIVRDFEHNSGFHTGEINFFPEYNCKWNFFTGVRYAQFNESFFIRDLGPNIENSYHLKNKMIGFQIGVRKTVWDISDWFSLEAMVNGGIYSNRITREDRSGTISGGTTLARKATDNDVAFLGEATLTAVYQMTDCVALRGGYQVMFVDGIMTADEAILGPGLVTGSLLYHGASVGLEYRR